LALMKVSESVAQRMAKLMQSLSFNTQPKENIPSPVQKQSNSADGIIWESVFSTEFKHKDITINDTVAVRERDTGEVCVMGATALDTSAPGRSYRCRIRIAEMNTGIFLGVTSQNILRANNFVPIDGTKLGHGQYINGNDG
jgi:hypothetical protein